VDSGHYCHKGHNEVFLMQRGTDKQMEKMKKILVGEGFYDPTVPHSNGIKPPWPTTEQIEECGKIG